LISIFSENPDLVLIPPGANASIGKPGFFAATNLLKAPVSAAAIDHEEHVTEVIARVCPSNHGAAIAILRRQVFGSIYGPPVYGCYPDRA
jgi:hypothetical protein